MESKPSTNPTIFLRLRQADPEPRQIAWKEFHGLYAPMIVGFCRKLGLSDADMEDVVQDVLMGFFSKAPTFVYDPSKGRFRGYLKVCTQHAAQRRLRSERRQQADQSVDSMDEPSVDHLWNDVWESELLRQAMVQLKKEMGDTKAFQSFERYVMLEQPADKVAADLGMHINSIYRAKEQIVRTLQERLAHRREIEG
jgi:RNA polymerase sigma factor (sigma-70 family)